MPRRLLKKGERVDVALISRTKKRETYSGTVLAADDRAIRLLVPHFELKYDVVREPRFGMFARRELTHETEHVVPWTRVHTIEVLAPVAAGGKGTQ